MAVSLWPGPDSPVFSVAHVLLGALIEFLGERHDVHAVLAKRGADRGGRSRFAGRDLQLDVTSYFLRHFNAPPKFVVR